MSGLTNVIFLLFQVSHSWSRIKSRGGPPALFGHSAMKVKLARICGLLGFFIPLSYNKKKNKKKKENVIFTVTSVSIGFACVKNIMTEAISFISF